jgi:hypothetical protein
VKRLLPILLLAAAPEGKAAASGPAEALTLELPGEVLRTAPAYDPAGRRGLAVLIGAGKAKSLWFLVSGARSAEPLAGGLHEEVSALTAFDLDGDGRATPVVGMPGVLWAPDGKGGVSRLFAEPHADLLSVLPRSRPSTPLPWIPIARAGHASLLGPDGGGGLTRDRTFALPQAAERPRWGLRLASPASRRCSPAGPIRWASGGL